MKLDLGIVIVNYNVRDLLRDCLASVYDSRGDFVFEVCVVDNGSADGSADMVADEFPQVRLIRAENRGYAASLCAIPEPGHRTATVGLGRHASLYGGPPSSRGGRSPAGAGRW
jgi:hypothetical protein